MGTKAGATQLAFKNNKQWTVECAQTEKANQYDKPELLNNTWKEHFFCILILVGIILTWDVLFWAVWDLVVNLWENQTEVICFSGILIILFTYRQTVSETPNNLVDVA